MRLTFEQYKQICKEWKAADEKIIRNIGVDRQVSIFKNEDGKYIFLWVMPCEKCGKYRVTVINLSPEAFTETFIGMGMLYYGLGD